MFPAFIMTKEPVIRPALLNFNFYNSILRISRC